MSPSVVRRRGAAADDETQVIQDSVIATDKVPKYPSEWFKVNKSKPKISFKLCEKDTVEDIGLYLLAKETRLASVDVAMSYVYLAMVRKPSTLQKEWTSFGQTIGDKEASITIDDLAQITKEPANSVKISGAKHTWNSDLERAVCLMVCAVYRIAGIKRTDYRETVEKNIMAEFKGLVRSDDDITGFLKEHAFWYQNPSYRALMAIVDMYLNEFPLHDLAIARMGTIVTRFKDCTALTGLQYLMTMTNLQFSVFSFWLWTDQLGTQLTRVLRPGEEYDNARSYAFYFMELGLSDKSPYSARVNPDLHLFIHTVGTSLGVPRSTNAIMVGSPCITETIHNAIVFAFVIGKYHKFTHQFVYDTDNGLDDALEEEELILDTIHRPKSADPHDWLQYIISLHCEVPNDMRRKVMRQWSKNPNVRDGTIGEYLRCLILEEKESEELL